MTNRLDSRSVRTEKGQAAQSIHLYEAKRRVTADEWDRCPRSDWMLLPLHEWLLANPALARPFDRKLRLYAAACCRRCWNLFERDLFQRAVEAAERLADGRADGLELAAIHDAIMAIPTPNAQSHCIENMTLKLISVGGMQCAAAAAMDLGVAIGWDHFEPVVQGQAQLLRCVVGNPFRSVAFDPLWRSSAVVEIADSLYADRAFERMPMLADALEDAGCAHTGVLQHCRDGGPHVRGCWVIDKLLEEV